MRRYGAAGAAPTAIRGWALHPTGVAIATLSLLALALVSPALLGWTSLGFDDLLDSDPLYRADAPRPRPPLVGDGTSITLDYPRDLAVARSVQEGRLAQWNPHAAFGAPLWAEQGGPFFPLKLPFYLAPARSTYVVFLALRLVLAGFGAYLLARHRSVRPGAALAAGAMFELSGPLIVQLPYGTLSPNYMLPWVVLGTMQIAKRRTAAAAVGAAAALGLTALGGHPPSILIVSAGFAAATFGNMIREWRTPTHALVIALWSAVAALLGVALAAPSLGPLLELASVGQVYKQTIDGLRFWHAARFFSETATPVALLLPDLLPVSTRVAPWLGLVGVSLAAAGLSTLRLGAPLIALAVVGVVLSALPPASGWTHLIPVVNVIRPLNGWPLLALVLTQALGDGVEVLTQLRLRRVVLVVGLLAVAAPLWVWASRIPGAGRWDVEVAEIQRVLDGALTGWGVTYLFLPAVVAAAALGVCVASQRTRFWHSCATGIVVIAVAELWLRMLFVTTRHPPSKVLTAPPSAGVRALQEGFAAADGRIMAPTIHVAPPITPMLFGLADLRNVSALPVARYYDYLAAAGPIPPGFALSQTVAVFRSPLLDLASVRYIAVPRPLGSSLARTLEEDPLIPLVWENEGIGIYENQAALPRARIVRRFDAVGDQDAVAERLKKVAAHATHARETELTETVLLEADDQGRLPPVLAGDPSPADVVRIVDATDFDRLVVEAQLDQPGLLVVADTYYPGWHARLDGTPVPIFPANLLFRAVFVPAGRHTIEFRYESAAFTYGLALSASAALAAGVLLFRARSRRTAL